MKTLILYASKHGTTKKCATILSEKLDGTVETYNIGNDKVPSLSNYDRVVIGGSIYMGRIQKEISEFCIKNLENLKDKKLGFYVCCMFKSEEEKQINNAFPAELLKCAAASDSFGGEMIFSDMGFGEKTISRMAKKMMVQNDPHLADMDFKKDYSKLSYDKIELFAQKLVNS